MAINREERTLRVENVVNSFRRLDRLRQSVREEEEFLNSEGLDTYREEYEGRTDHDCMWDVTYDENCYPIVKSIKKRETDDAG